MKTHLRHHPGFTSGVHVSVLRSLPLLKGNVHRRFFSTFLLSASGGNKRKLGAAVALVGDPPVVFLVSVLQAFIHMWLRLIKLSCQAVFFTCF